MSEVLDLKTSANKLMAESIAKKIKEKPEDVIWFFEIKSAMESLEKGKFAKFKDTGVEIPESVSKLLSEARKAYKKFKRIERKLKEAGLV
ncbi:hypothetical protein [Thermococcus barophilus]|uniref:Uncharacterized protein n=1 Tax=Thermococcus barophilus TaxID=55802 RepID=A0A0S1XFA7_THEBA|nr:hypothetical protein [Thermococcus barophilus]ALM76459.1 hypothetical protein TBCH5v1_2570 [Thermococcus barophilus]